MKQALFLVLTTALLAGCGAVGHPAAMVRPASHAAVKADDALAQDVQHGFRQIFVTYDKAPKDDKLSYGEFGHVVTREWFQQHDTNHDGVILFDEWLTPAELASQVADIRQTGQGLVKQADKDGDGLMTLGEYQAVTFEIDATPWLAGPADGNIKADAFRKFAGTDGRMGAEQAAAMIGDLLAYGYYLDDGSDNLRP